MEGAAVEDEGEDGSGSSVEILPAFAFAFPATRQGRLDRLQMLAQWMETRTNAINAFRVAFLQILGQTGPQLRSLAILFYLIYDRNSDNGLSTSLSLSYPQLTELTVREEFLSLSWPSLRMPSLQDLQIAGGNPPYPQGLFEALSEGCLQPTRLRLSEPFINEEVALELKKTFLHKGTSAKEKGDTGMIFRGLPSLKIVLQPCLLRASRPQSLDVMECLREIEAKVDAFELREPSDRSSDRYPFAEAASEWDARLQFCSEGT